MIKVFLQMDKVEVVHNGEKVTGLRPGGFCRLEEVGMPSAVITNPLLQWLQAGLTNPVEFGNYVFIVEATQPGFNDANDEPVTPQEN